MRFPIISALIMVIAGGCENTPPPPAPVPLPTAQDLERENQRILRIEEGDIDSYVQRHSLEPVKSGTGVRVQLIRDKEGAPVKPEQLARVNYRLELIDGSVAYETEAGKPESFRVEHDDVESGLHEAIQRLGPGDSAVIIIPSYRAHGLIGDRERIPMRSTVIYYLGLVDVRDP